MWPVFVEALLTELTLLGHKAGTSYYHFHPVLTVDLRAAKCCTSFGQVQEQGGGSEGISLSSYNQTAACGCLEMDQSVHRPWEPARVGSRTVGRSIIHRTDFFSPLIKSGFGQFLINTPSDSL